MQAYVRYAAVESTVTRVVPFSRCLSPVRASPQQAARPYPIGYFHCVRAADGPFALTMTGLSARPIFFEVQVCAEVGWGRFRAPGPGARPPLAALDQTAIQRDKHLLITASVWRRGL
jgi:hypothetical protein